MDDRIVFGGLTASEWRHVGQVIMRWPRLGVATPAESQALIESINAALSPPPRDIPNGDQ